MFNDCPSLITIPPINTSNVTKMTNMFASCDNLRSVPQLNTSKVTDISYLFYYCYQITSIPQLTIASGANMSYMFYSCHNLPTIDVSRLQTFGMSNFAKDCYSLTKFIIRTIPSSTTMPKFGSNMLTNCYHLTGTVDATYNPEGLQDGRIYVPDDKVEELKAATGWSEFADVIVPLSTLVED